MYEFLGNKAERIMVSDPSVLTSWLLSNRPDKRDLTKYFSRGPCQDIISDEYIEYSLLNSDFVVMSYKPVKNNVPEEPIDAFAFLKRTGLNRLHIDIICGPGRGKALFTTIARIATYYSIKYITLGAIDTAFLVYADRYGFKIDSKHPYYKKAGSDLEVGKSMLKFYTKLPAAEKIRNRSTQKYLDTMLDSMNNSRGTLRDGGFPMIIRTDKLSSRLK
jgi:hypothetical protein